MVDERIRIDGVIYTRTNAIDGSTTSYKPRYPGFKPGTELLRAGTVARRGYGALPCDIVFERDVAVELRDGTTIYADVFRPATEGPVPAIVAWSPYGKGGSGGTNLEDLPGMMGIDRRSLSGLHKWEAPDPAWWVARGYAVCNPDARGAFMSEGNIQYWGEQEARDAYDLIEWLAARPWCTGKVALSGNSWLAACQWHIAAQQPPHLAAIAPWEGAIYMYADDLVRGGIPNTGFCADVISQLFGNGYTENPPEMVAEHPLLDDYWKSKVPDLSRVEVPAYVVASWSSQVHTNGTFAAWRGIASKEKWLRVHNSQEWPDYYSEEGKQDLLRFFDHYLKGADNGWEDTPRIRLSVLDPGGSDIVNRVEQEFPPARARETAYYLDAASGALSGAPADAEAEAVYDSESKHCQVSFEMAFDEDVEIIGYPKLRLWVEADGHDDMDLFAYVQKLDAHGRQLIHHTVRPEKFPWKQLYGSGKVNGILYPGPNGRLRVSLRALDEAASTPSEPVHTFDHHEKLAPGEVVPVEIGLWPCGMAFHKGERLRLVVAGRNINGSPLPSIPDATPDNCGRHIIHTGGPYDSHLLLPVVRK